MKDRYEIDYFTEVIIYKRNPKTKKMDHVKIRLHPESIEQDDFALLNEWIMGKHSLDRYQNAVQDVK